MYLFTYLFIYTVHIWQRIYIYRYVCMYACIYISISISIYIYIDVIFPPPTCQCEGRGREFSKVSKRRCMAGWHAAGAEAGGSRPAFMQEPRLECHQPQALGFRVLGFGFRV